MTADDWTLGEAREHWGSAYQIGYQGGCWQARRGTRARCSARAAAGSWSA